MHQSTVSLFKATYTGCKCSLSPFEESLAFLDKTYEKWVLKTLIQSNPLHGELWPFGTGSRANDGWSHEDNKMIVPLLFMDENKMKEGWERCMVPYGASSFWPHCGLRMCWSKHITASKSWLFIRTKHNRTKHNTYTCVVPAAVSEEETGGWANILQGKPVLTLFSRP